MNGGTERYCYACMPVRREAGLRRRDLIGADGQFRDVVHAFGIGGNHAGQISGGVADGDCDGGDAPAARIADGAVKSAADERGLTESGSCQQKETNRRGCDGLPYHTLHAFSLTIASPFLQPQA